MHGVVCWLGTLTVLATLAPCFDFFCHCACAQVAAADRPPLYRGRTLEAWLVVLGDGREDEQLLAIQAVGEFGPESRAYSSALAKKLTSSKPEIRFAAAEQLARWGADAKSAGVDLARALVDIDPKIGAAAAMALRTIGKDANDATRIAVANAIEDRDGAVRENTIEVMKYIGWHKESVAVLGRALSSKDAQVRHAALEAVDYVSTDLVAPLREKVHPLIADENLLVRMKTESVLDKVGADDSCAASIAASIVAAIEHPDDEVKRSGLRAVRRAALRDPAKPVAPKIATLLEHKEWHIREAAALGLWALDYDDRRAARVLGESISTGRSMAEDTDVVAAIGDLGPLGQDAVPLLIKRFESPRQSDGEELRDANIRAIAKIGPDAVRSFADLLTSRRPLLRAAAAKALVSIGQQAEPALPNLARALGDSDVDVRVFAAHAIGNVSAKATKFSEELATARQSAFNEYLSAATPRLNPRSERFPLNSAEAPDFYRLSDPAKWLVAVAEASWRVDRDDAALVALETMLTDASDAARAAALRAIDRNCTEIPESIAGKVNGLLAHRTRQYPGNSRSESEGRRHDRQAYWHTEANHTAAVSALRIAEKYGKDTDKDSDVRTTFDAIKLIAREDPRPDVALAAARAWWRLMRDPEAARAAADCFSADRFPESRGQSPEKLAPAAAVIEVLTEMGEAAKVALPQITLVFHQADEDELKNAIGALIQRLDPETASKLGVNARE